MQNQSTIIKSPLRYPGGKQKLAAQLVSMFPAKAVELRDPMVGGGSVVLAATQRNFAQCYWMNDISQELMSFWQVVQEPAQCERLVGELESLRSSFENADEIKAYFNAVKAERGTDRFRQAVLFFFKNRVTFSGTTEAGGFSPSAALSRFTRSSIERLKPLPRALQNIRITCEDFAAMIQQPGQDVFLFLDPPHYNRAKIYGPKGTLNNFEHDTLASLLRETPHRFLITLDDCNEVRSLYKWARIQKWDIFYGMTNCNAKREPKRGSELLISNCEI
jgi:DNA adenine methylase